MLWEIDIHPLPGQRDRDGERVATLAAELGIAADLQVNSARGFLLESDSIDSQQAQQLANELFADATVEQAVVGRVGESSLTAAPARNGAALLHVLLKPGVMDPVAQSAEAAVA